MRVSCDIFCNVIDNYGDIGVCWRLARQLASEHALQVRLWVDDLGSFVKLCPEADATLEQQHRRGVEVRHWAGDLAEVQPADLVIEAFACKLPPEYIEAMAARKLPPVWINLEYLSAEDWVHGCHKLPSPHPRLQLTKYFFFPGFTALTGGLLLEQDLLARRDAFQSDFERQQAYWHGLGVDVLGETSLKVSLFGYENAGLSSLFDAWAEGEQSVLCLVPEGRILPQIEKYFGDANSHRSIAGEGMGESGSLVRGNLSVRVLPFVEQEQYDELLWACDVNFVRGEDSCIRAQWAGRPFVWQIYPQHDEVHWGKLQAFLDLYQLTLSPDATQAMQGLWQAWNDESGAGAAWSAFDLARGELNGHAQTWARELARNNLALNLLDFYTEVGRIRAFEIEGQ